jgi:hypothetical protein
MVLAQLHAMRQQVEATILIAERELGTRGVAPGVAEARGACPHPDGAQVNGTTMGGTPTVVCLVCGAQYPGVLATP